MFNLLFVHLHCSQCLSVLESDCLVQLFLFASLFISRESGEKKNTTNYFVREREVKILSLSLSLFLSVKTLGNVANCQKTH